MENKETQSASTGKIIVFALICAVLFFAVYKYQGNQGQTKRQTVTATIPQVIVNYVEPFDASSAATEYVGRVEAMQTVAVKPQISGEIKEVSFKEGSVVKAGQLLYQIDPKQYAATVQLRKAELEQARAEFVTAEKYYNRMKATNAKAVSATDKETAEGNYLKAKAAVSQAQANLKLAEIDLGYCKITSPITGKISKTYYTRGNYVTPSVEQLAEIVQITPIRVTYPLTDREYLNQLALFKENGTVFNTKITLSNGEQYELNGERDFESNSVDVSTGTITMNLRFDNEDGRLIPGEMVRVYTTAKESRYVNAVPQTAVLTDSQGDYVYVVNEDSTVSRRNISLGQVFGALREVTEGLEAGEGVAVAGLHGLRDGMKVSAVYPVQDSQTGENE